MQRVTPVEYPDCRPVRIANLRILESALVLPLSIAALVSATGGAYTPDVYNRIMKEGGIRSYAEIGNRAQPEYARSIAQHLLNIRDGFGLRMSEVAQIFGVSRTAAYAWLDGAIPKPEITAKLLDLSRQADMFREAGVERIEHFTRRPVVGCLSLLDLLKSGSDLRQAITVIKQTASLEAQNRATSPKAQAEGGRSRNIVDDISIPILPERG